MTATSKNRLIEQIRSAWPPHRWDQYRVVIAVSGGADSVALLKGLAEISAAEGAQTESLIVAHFNHRLRGAASDEDAEFVRQLAHQHGLPFRYAASDSSECRSEEQSRNARYRFLVETARETNSRYIATAHHRDDQVETVLFRLFRGTGVGGLAGIPFSRVVDESLTIVRPLLRVEKATIESALNQWRQAYRTDATNQESNWSRNFIRNEVLPQLRERFSSVDESVARLSVQAGQQHSLLCELVEPLFESVTEVDDGVLVSCEHLLQQPAVLLRELFAQIFKRQSWPVSQLGYRELERLAQLVVSAADEARFQLPGAISCQKQGGLIRFSIRPDAEHSS